MLTSAYQLFRAPVPDPEWAQVVPHFRWGWGGGGVFVCVNVWEAGVHGMLAAQPRAAATAWPWREPQVARTVCLAGVPALLLTSAVAPGCHDPWRCRHMSERERRVLDPEGSHSHGWFYTTVIT